MLDAIKVKVQHILFTKVIVLKSFQLFQIWFVFRLMRCYKTGQIQVKFLLKINMAFAFMT